MCLHSSPLRLIYLTIHPNSSHCTSSAKKLLMTPFDGFVALPVDHRYTVDLRVYNHGDSIRIISQTKLSTFFLLLTYYIALCYYAFTQTKFDNTSLTTKVKSAM